ncbi:hypothetical protein DRO24_04350 [Candidatus Bathyarchaeota archaeon]|nr:MAG: hypothetical protein DRO24_04350 [Candidatus Bathyarchaeota archaeon]
MNIIEINEATIHPLMLNTLYLLIAAAVSEEMKARGVKYMPKKSMLKIFPMNAPRNAVKGPMMGPRIMP